MGDVAMTVPVIRAFMEQFGSENSKMDTGVTLTFISNPFFKPFFDDIPNVNFFAFDAKNRHKGFLGLIRLFLDLKKLKIDAFADLHNVLRSKVVRNLFILNGIKVISVNKGRAGKRALIRSKNKIFTQQPTTIRRYVKVFRKLGFTIDLSHPNFPEKASLDPEIVNLIGEFPKSRETKWIGIAPFAQYDSKVYPIDLMQEVINQLAENKNNKILLFGGGAKEIKILNLLSGEKENVINVAGKIKFQQELHLISNLDVMLSMDSGNAHIAAMLGVKVVTLWGATHPFSGFAPFNQPVENTLLSDRELFPKLPTSVYGNKKVEGYEDAMRTISPEMVVNRVLNQIADFGI